MGHQNPQDGGPHADLTFMVQISVLSLQVGLSGRRGARELGKEVSLICLLCGTEDLVDVP